MEREEELRREIAARKAAIRGHRRALQRAAVELLEIQARRLGVGFRVAPAKGKEIPWPTPSSTSTS